MHSVFIVIKLFHPMGFVSLIPRSALLAAKNRAKAGTKSTIVGEVTEMKARERIKNSSRKRFVVCNRMFNGEIGRTTDHCYLLLRVAYQRRQFFKISFFQSRWLKKEDQDLATRAYY